MLFHELFRLNEHPARTTAGIVNFSFIGCEDLNQHPDDGSKRVKLPALFALGVGKLSEEVFVNLPENVLCFVPVEADLLDEIDELAEFSGLKLCTCKTFIQQSF